MIPEISNVNASMAAGSQTNSTERLPRQTTTKRLTNRLSKSIDKHLSTLMEFVERAEMEALGGNPQLNKTLDDIQNRLSLLSPNVFSHFNKKYSVLEQELQDKYRPIINLGVKPR